MNDPQNDLGRARLLVLIAYLAAAIGALLAAIALRERHPIVIALGAHLAATVVVFAFSLGLRNSSLYDPCWSVAPPLLALGFCFASAERAVPVGRQAGVVLLVTLWAVRLTHNWLRGWQGLGHEDWRYVDLRRTCGRFYWPVSFGGIHLFPTAIVFAGALPLWSALAIGERPIGALDGAALIVTVAGIAFEFFADEQLRRFRTTPAPPGAILASGLWAFSRHPNYFGEILFWWGVALFGHAATGFLWWNFAGAAAITALFVFVSIPLIEARMRAHRPAFAAHASRVSTLVPWPPRSE